jgi:hypothetical protein
MIQGCLLRVQKCMVGRSQDVSSSVPARTRRKPLSELDAPQTQEPHSGQTHRVTTPPLSAVRWMLAAQSPLMRKVASVYDSYLQAFSQIRIPVKFPAAAPNLGAREPLSSGSKTSPTSSRSYDGASRRPVEGSASHQLPLRRTAIPDQVYALGRNRKTDRLPPPRGART